MKKCSFLLLLLLLGLCGSGTRVDATGVFLRGRNGSVGGSGKGGLNVLGRRAAAGDRDTMRVGLELVSPPLCVNLFLLPVTGQRAERSQSIAIAILYFDCLSHRSLKYEAEEGPCLE